MSLGNPMTKINFDDNALDDPKQAFSELATNVDEYNTLQNLLQSIATLLIGDGLKDDGAGNLDLDLATDSGLEIVSQKVRAKVTEGLQRKAANAGIALDLNGLTTEVVDAAADFFAFFDVSLGLHKKVLSQDVIPIATQGEAQAGANAVKRMTPQRTFDSIAKILSDQMEVVTVTAASHPVPSWASSAFVILTGKGGNGANSVGSNPGGAGGGAGTCVALIIVPGGGTINIQIGVNTTIDSTLAVANGGGNGVLATGGGGGGSGGSASTTGIDVATISGEAGQSAGAGGKGGNNQYWGSLGSTAGNPAGAGSIPGGGGGGGTGASGAGGAGGVGRAFIIWLG